MEDWLFQMSYLLKINTLLPVKFQISAVLFLSELNDLTLAY